MNMTSKNEDNLKKWRQPQKWRQSQKWERPQKWRQYSRNFMPTPPVPTVQIWDSIDVGGGRDIAENSRPPWLSLDFEIWILGMRGRDKPDNSRPPPKSLDIQFSKLKISLKHIMIAFNQKQNHFWTKFIIFPNWVLSIAYLTIMGGDHPVEYRWALWERWVIILERIGNHPWKGWWPSLGRRVTS